MNSRTYSLWVVVILVVLAFAAGFFLAKGIKYAAAWASEHRENKGIDKLNKYNDRALMASIIISSLAELLNIDTEEDLTQSDNFTSEVMDKEGFITYTIMSGKDTDECISCLTNLKTNKICINYAVPLNDEDKVNLNKSFDLGDPENMLGMISVQWVMKCRKSIMELANGE